jgi:6-phosphogluconolactonase
MTSLTTCPDPATVAERAAAHIVRELRLAREQRGVAHVALSGGTSPRHTYELLGADPAELADTHMWFADERCVPPDDEESNFLMAAESMLRPAAIEDRHVHRMRGELGPEEGAAAYAQELEATFAAQAPVLDIAVLGIGPDGHIASLFPGAATLDADEHELCLGVRGSPKPPPERITLSLGVLNAARGCLVVATGAGKADAISAMLAEPSRHVPASLLPRARLTVITDDAAAPDGPVQ